MLGTSIYSREKYEEAIAAIPPGTIDGLLGSFIAKAGEGDLLDVVLAARALHLRRACFTQWFPDQPITAMRWPLPPDDDDGITVAVR